VKEINQKKLIHFVSEELPQKLYRINIDDDSKERGEEIKETISQRSDLNLVFYFNHTSLFDPLLVGSITRRINPEGQIVAPMSYSNTEKKLKNVGKIFMANIIENCGVKTFRVIQSYQIKDPKKYPYSQELIGKQNMAFFRGLRELAKEKRKAPISMIISPEGHRSKKTKALIMAESGIVTAGSMLSQTLYIPIGIDFEKGLFRKRVNLSIGETYLQEGRADRVDLDVLMHNLAAALPEARRGMYGTATE